MPLGVRWYRVDSAAFLVAITGEAEACSRSVIPGLCFPRPTHFSSSSTMADAPTLSVTMLGAGQEVGRSCCVLQYRGRTIVCDTGIHPALSGIASLPFIDELDWSTVDAILVTQ